jgi:IS30 family transposase
MAGRRGQRWVTASEQLEIRRRVASGEAIRSIAAGLGRTTRTILNVIARAGSIPPRATIRSPLRLSVAEREEISRGLRAGESFRLIATRLGRRPSSVSREVGANGGRRRYRAHLAETRAAARARRPRPARLARNRRLRRIVERLLELRWSPQQIAWQLRQDHPDEPEMWVSHETIYQSLFVQGRGALRAELTRCLRSGRAQRRPAGRAKPTGALANMVLLSERPAEVEDRAVPGHWEGDLIIGKANRSAIGTLVERQTRFVMLVALPRGRTAEAVRVALAERILSLPVELRRSLTWDRGGEMSEHVRFTVETGVQVYFCDPHSPWQRGSNENTNGLVRQYFPKGTDLSVHSQDRLDQVARELNGRPRQTLGWMKPSEALAKVVALTG